MKCIVPLAGPDIYSETYGLKPAFRVDGEALIKQAIHSRSWYGQTLFEEDLIFVLRDFSELSELRTLIDTHFPKSKQVTIPDITKGAMMSSLAGISIINEYDEPIIVDLVDIIFKSEFNPTKIFDLDIDISGIIPYFKSKHKKYSYLEIDKKNNVCRTREKEVISNNASAGVYMFRNLGKFIQAAGYLVKNHESLAYNNLLYICPSFNGIISENERVKSVEVIDIQDISILIG